MAAATNFKPARPVARTSRAGNSVLNRGSFINSSRRRSGTMAMPQVAQPARGKTSHDIMAAIHEAKAGLGGEGSIFGLTILPQRYWFDKLRIVRYRDSAESA
jgi:hypothetical protein